MLLGIGLLSAGCLGSAGPSEDGRVQPASVNATVDDGEPWTLEGNVSLGWIAAAGTHAAAGDTIVGVRSHDQCPSVSFVVPAGANTVSITFTPSLVGSGAGTYTVAIASPDAVTYISPPISEASFEDEEPEAGPWVIELKPQGATVNQTWPFEIVVDGDREAPSELGLTKDGDCLL